LQQDQNELEPNIQSDIDEVNNLMKIIYNSTIGQSSLKDKGFLLQASAALLQDGVQSYQLSNATSSGSSFSTVDYENALGLSSTSMANFEIVADSVNDRRRQEIRSFYNQLIEGISNNQPFDTVASIASALERDFLEELSLTSGGGSGSEQLQYFSNIRELLSEVVSSINDDGDYQAANSAAIKAYLDNYEYLEAPIEKHDPKLMLDIESVYLA
jgi:high-affinity iron transporter